MQEQSYKNARNEERDFISEKDQWKTYINLEVRG